MKKFSVWLICIGVAFMLPAVAMLYMIIYGGTFTSDQQFAGFILFMLGAVAILVSTIWWEGIV